MSAGQPGPYESVARKWLALAERRRAHLVELRESGRWQQHLMDAEIEKQLHNLDVACARFAEVAGIEPAMAPVDDLLPASPSQRLFANRLRLRA
jgi:hypothetical protein